MNHTDVDRIRLPRTTCSCTDGSRSLRPGDTPIGPRVADVKLRFEVSRDEEHVRLRIEREGVCVDMRSRSHHYLLVTLARRRLADATAGHPGPSCGWIHQDELTRDPNLPPPLLNVHVFRVRKQIALVGLLDPEQIIERRADARQMRVGTGHLEVVTV